MIKNLKEQIEKEIARMTGALENLIKQFINEEDVTVKLDENLNNILVKIVKNEEKDNTLKITHYNFFYSKKEQEEDDGPENVERTFSTFVNNVILEKDVVIGTYTSAVQTELALINGIFQKIEVFIKNETEENATE